MLSNEELERYNRQILLPQIGAEGQEQLRQSRILIVGAGGLGTPCACYLAGMGIGCVGLVDNDVVSLSNLPRQIMYGMNDLGKEKARVLSEKLQKANPHIEVTPIIEKVTEENALTLVQGYDAVVSCVDDLDTRYVLNEACVKSLVPMVEGAILGFTGLLTVIVPGKGPCYHCIFPKKQSYEKKPIGVVGPAPGVIGSMQAAEVLKLLLGKGKPAVGRLVVIDLLSGDFRSIEVKRNPECSVCRHIST